MTKTVSLLSALLCTFIWGTTFIAQDTGMDDIGPFTFNAVRFFVGFLAVTPLAFIFEKKNFLKSINKEKKNICKTSNFNWYIFIFRIGITTSCFTLYRCCKCSIFHSFLCAYGPINYLFYI